MTVRQNPRQNKQGGKSQPAGEVVTTATVFDILDSTLQGNEKIVACAFVPVMQWKGPRQYETSASVPTIAEKAGLSVRTTQMVLNKLEKLGAVTTVKASRGGYAGLHSTSTRRLNRDWFKSHRVHPLPALAGSTEPADTQAPHKPERPEQAGIREVLEAHTSHPSDRDLDEFFATVNGANNGVMHQ